MARDVSENDDIPNSNNAVKEISQAIKPLLMFENLFGIFRVSVTDAGFVPASKKIKLIATLEATVLSVLLFLRVDLPESLTDTRALVDIIEEIPAMIGLVQYTAAVVWTLFFLDEPTIQILTTFAEIDTTLRINLKDDFSHKCRVRIILYLILLVIIHSIVAVADMSTDDKFDAMKLIKMILYFIQDLEILAFCVMVSMLRSRLVIVNDYLEKFVYEKDINKSQIFIVDEKNEILDKQFNFIGRITSSNMKIRDLAATYDTIGNIGYLINNVFKFQIFMNLVSTFAFILITIWTSLYYFRTPGSTYGPLVTALSWCLLTVISVAIMSFTCESLLTVRNNTKILVNEIIMDYDLPRSMRIQAKVFMELIDAWPLRIFVYDMFSVDIKLMLKFVSVATTYLIVIIQISHFV